MNIVTLVLVDGSQIVGKQIAGDTGVLLEDARKILPILDDKNQWQLAFQNFPLEAKNPIYIEEKAIITIAVPSENMERFYIQSTTTLDLTTQLK